MNQDRKIVPWKNTGKKLPKKVFKISWDSEKRIWVKDAKGKHWGHYDN